MSLRRTSSIAVLAVALLAGSAAPATPAGAGRALWVWKDAGPAQARFAARRGIDRLFVQLIEGSREAKKVRSLQRTAARQGVEVWAMGGRREWALEPAPMLAMVRAGARDGSFDGIVLDVEPYTLDAWDDPETRTAVMRSYLRGLERATRAADGLRVLAAVPFWFDHDGYRLDGRTYFEQVLDRVDGVVVMAYRDSADGRNGIVRLAADEVRAATAAGKTALVGIQVSDDELDLLSFAEEGPEALERELERVQAAFAAEPGFGGAAIHHYHSYRELLKR